MTTAQSIADLWNDLREHQHKIEHIEDAIARHPEHIAEVFAGSWLADLVPATIGEIDRLGSISGDFDQGGRGKNVIQWNGYRYRLKGDQCEYWVRSGDNWCSSVRDWAKYGKDDAT